MKVKTSELSGAALDWAVAKCNQDWTEEDRWYNTIGYVDSGDPDDEPYMPSENWAQGGPLIERENIQIGKGCNSGSWCANQIGSGHAWITAATPLVAAMRCFVASRLGDEVDVPNDFYCQTTPNS